MHIQHRDDGTLGSNGADLRQDFAFTVLLPLRDQHRPIGHAGSGPGSTIAVLSFIDRNTPITLAAAVDLDEPDRFIKLFEQLNIDIGRGKKYLAKP